MRYACLCGCSVLVRKATHGWQVAGSNPAGHVARNSTGTSGGGWLVGPLCLKKLFYCLFSTFSEIKLRRVAKVCCEPDKRLSRQRDICHERFTKATHNKPFAKGFLVFNLSSASGTRQTHSSRSEDQLDHFF
jgi:hypothetical protein